LLPVGIDGLPSLILDGDSGFPSLFPAGVTGLPSLNWPSWTAPLPQSLSCWDWKLALAGEKLAGKTSLRGIIHPLRGTNGSLFALMGAFFSCRGIMPTKVNIHFTT